MIKMTNLLLSTALAVGGVALVGCGDKYEDDMNARPAGDEAGITVSDIPEGAYDRQTEPARTPYRTGTQDRMDGGVTVPSETQEGINPGTIPQPLSEEAQRDLERQQQQQRQTMPNR